MSAPVTCQQMQQLEAAAFASGVSEAELMQQAGEGIAQAIARHFPCPGLAILFLGKGHNAGDALVAGLLLARAGWRIALRLAFPASELKPLTRQHLSALEPLAAMWLGSADDTLARASSATGPILCIDGLVGIGAVGELRGALAELALEMNALRTQRQASTVALDLPSGLDADSGATTDTSVQADLTLTIGFAKTGLIAEAAPRYVGRLEIVALAALSQAAARLITEPDPRVLLTPEYLRPLLPRRPFDMHKGQAGRVGIIAGSPGFSGAAVLASLGALRGGAGLITLLVKADAYDLIAAKAPPEIMVRRTADYGEAAKGYDVVAIGPGIGFAAEKEVRELLRRAEVPMVVDADALTIAARHRLVDVEQARGPRLLTPHPGEMARLTLHQPALQGLDRQSLVTAFVRRKPHLTLLLKGARTLISEDKKPTLYNTTGHPGMASGGMGDVLTGVLAALIGQGCSARDAAALGSWLCGRAAEIAMSSGSRSGESLSATDIAERLGQACESLRL